MTSLPTVRRLALAALGSGALLAFLLPARGLSWSALGGTLALSQRDVRVFDNFTDPEARDNQTPDPNFPGATGAPLAIWKAIAEWGSEKRYDGLGDPTQGEIGSGGANFDAHWQGLATSVGRPDSNVVSEISGSSLGVIAFTETPIQDGWRIRFYADASVLEDGPDFFTPLPGHKDIQGVMTHEYGHALGLDHSGIDPSLTMFPSASGTLIERRSLEWDDVDGVRGLYGVRAPTKPHVAFYRLSGTAITIEGERFAPLANEVWFTDGSPLADGSPLVVANLPSTSGGTRITLTIPATAVRGDVLVHVPGTDGASLSNALPFDPSHELCPIPTFVGVSKTTSIGTSPDLFVLGRATLLTNDLVIGTDGGVPGALGLLFSGGASASTPFFGGTLYSSRPWVRHGSFTFDFFGSAAVPVPVTPASLGTTRTFQLWFQDTGDPFGVGLSNGARVTFCP
jgi:hypothetical protein